MSSSTSEQFLSEVNSSNEVIGVLVSEQLNLGSGNVLLVRVPQMRNNDFAPAISVNIPAMSDERIFEETSPMQELLESSIGEEQKELPVLMNADIDNSSCLISDAAMRKSVKRFKCSFEDCGWAFDTTYKLRRHEESHTGRREFQCIINGCGRMFTTQYNLKTHMRLHERTSTVLCPICGEIFQTNVQKDKHMKTHGDNLKLYRCSHEGCTREFGSVASLNSHQRSHQGVNEYICEFNGCGRRFDQHCRLKQHQRTHTKEKPYPCCYEGCNWSFATSSQLLRHKLIHTGQRKYACPYEGCLSSFSRQDHLKGHMSVHVSHKPYLCGLDGCGASFKSKWNLMLHMKKHSGGLENLEQELEISSHGVMGQGIEEMVENDLSVNAGTLFVRGGDQIEEDVGLVPDSIKPVTCSLSVHPADTYIHAQLLQDDPPGPELYDSGQSSFSSTTTDQSVFTSTIIDQSGFGSAIIYQSGFISPGCSQSVFSSHMNNQSRFSSADQSAFVDQSSSSSFSTTDPSAYLSVDQTTFSADIGRLLNSADNPQFIATHSTQLIDFVEGDGSDLFFKADSI